jgi:hypothetical protein
LGIDTILLNEVIEDVKNFIFNNSEVDENEWVVLVFILTFLL